MAGLLKAGEGEAGPQLAERDGALDRRVEPPFSRFLHCTKGGTIISEQTAAARRVGLAQATTLSPTEAAWG